MLTFRSAVDVETPVSAELHLAFDSFRVVGVLVHLFLQSLDAFVGIPERRTDFILKVGDFDLLVEEWQQILYLEFGSLLRQTDHLVDWLTLK